MKSFFMYFFTALTMAISLGMLYEIFSLRDNLYMMSANISSLEGKIAKIHKAAVSADIDIEFKEKMATAQRFLSIGQLRIHHFVEPHGSKFYPNCYECQKEKQQRERPPSRNQITSR